VASIGFGEPFRADDADDFARAARLVIEQPQRYRPADAALERFSWETQSRRLLAVYGKLLGVELEPGSPERMAELMRAAATAGT
jgi:hypothetical protein